MDAERVWCGGTVEAVRATPPLWPSVYLDVDQPTLLGDTSNAGSLVAGFDRELAGCGASTRCSRS